jgi:hypothetical protein
VRGGGVYKVRIARSGEGKSGGYRVIVFFRSEERTFFEYGFAKSDRDNIDEGDLRVFKKRAKNAFLLTNGARSRPCLHGHDRASEEPKGEALY